MVQTVIRPKEAEVTSTFKDFRIKENGAWLFKFKFPVTEAGRAASVLIFINRKFSMELSVLDGNGNPAEKVSIGVLRFGGLHVSGGGNGTLTVLGEKLEDMAIDAQEIQKFLDMSMVIYLREVFSQDS